MSTVDFEVMSKLSQERLYSLLTFEVLDDKFFGRTGFRVRQTWRDPIVDAVRIADCQRRKISPLLRVGCRIRHDDDLVTSDFVRLRDARSRGQLVALGSARVIQHHREIGGGGGSSSSSSSGGSAGSCGSGGGCSLHLSCGQNLSTTGPRHMRALSGRRPGLGVT